jgi:CRP/FNR family cyclic AMP-dependent transcriptional regulator
MDLKSILAGVELFEGLSPNEIQKVCALCKQREFTDNDIVAAQNSPGIEMFIIQEGFVEVSVQRKGGSAGKVIVNLGTGQTVGEMSLIDQGKRSATVRAISTPTVVQVISQRDFEELCDQDNHIGYVVMRNIATDLSFRLRQRHFVDLMG